MPERASSSGPFSTRFSTSSTSSSEDGSHSVPLTPNSDEFQSDLDFTASPRSQRLTAQRRSTPIIVRQRAMALGVKSMAEKRAKSVDSLSKAGNKENGKPRYNAVIALRDTIRAESKARSMELLEIRDSLTKKASTLGVERPRGPSGGGFDRLVRRPKSYHSPTTEGLRSLKVRS